MKFLNVTIMIIFVLCVISCERDQCDPPFSVGANYGYAVKDTKIIEKDPFDIDIGSFTTSVSYLYNLTIRLKLPPEIDVLQIKNTGKLKEVAGDYVWFGNIGKSEHVTLLILSLKSKTPWKEWRHPIEINIDTDYRSIRSPCGNWLDGHYGKKITWSKNGFVDSGWVKRPIGMEGIDLSK